MLFTSSCSQFPTDNAPAKADAQAVAAQWPESAQASPQATPQLRLAPAPQGGTLDWQTYFTDPTLRQLLETALQHNRDLRLATLGTLQAQAQLGLRQADQWPTVNASVSGSRSPSSAGSINSAYTGGLLVTAYELDFFGRVNSLKAQALAQYLASTEAAHTARISLLATVAQSWLALLADEELLGVTRQTLDTRAQSLKLIELKFQHGAASELDRQLAQTLLEATRVTHAQQIRQRALDENTLVLLLGQALPAPAQQALAAAAASPASAPAMAAPAAGGVTALALGATRLSQLQLAELPPGLPSAVLTRRPDIRQAELLLQASHANIDAARAAFFPRISLTAGVGSASSALANLFTAGSWGWTLAPQLVLPIFDAGRNQSNLQAAQVARDVALAQYDKAIQTAFREVADALASRASLAQQVQASQALLAAETQRHALTQLRLTHGAASQLDALDAQRSLFAAQQSAVQSRLAYLQNQVQLFKVIGGGASPAH
ncbi:TolC family protein [Rhodoferax sp.]|uniref:TolC family protein n=1 Tax=Rhodoferax sp. TaxID=50421 RepID=UPI002613291A|nr:TolC family protein [Rhodoferax sp.]MDD4943444.1 TolC family protein [Rhodoferax sp.]MDD5479328.1 TolC family protein [Rhodoferax sp.]